LQSRDFLHKRRAIELLVHDFAQYWSGCSFMNWTVRHFRDLKCL
jgi:hypothetical protein